MMIIGRDNLNRDNIADRVIVAGIPETGEHRAKAQAFCDWINSFSCNDYGGTHYVVAPNDYKLSRGMEDLI